MKKNLFIIVIIIIGLLLGNKIMEKMNSAALSNGKKKGRAVRSVPVEVADVFIDTIDEIGLFTGSLFPSSEYIVAPKVPGRLKSLHADIGDYVKNKELIAQMDSEELIQKLNQAEAELKIIETRLMAIELIHKKEINKLKADKSSKEATLTLTRNEYDRQSKLRKKSMVSESEMDQSKEKYLVAKSEFDSVQSNVELLQAEKEAESGKLQAELQRQQAIVNNAKLQLSFADIHVEWKDDADSRVIGERYVYAGSLLKVGDPIVKIQNIDTLIAVINVTEKDYSRIHTKQEVNITTDAYPEKEFKGTIVRIAPNLNEVSRVARVEIEVPNKDHLLKPGMYIRSKILFQSIKNAVIIPDSGLVNREGIECVFKVNRNGNTAEYIPVKTGIRNHDKIQVVSPVLTGEIVTLGRHLLSDNIPILLPASEIKVKKDKAEK